MDTVIVDDLLVINENDRTVVTDDLEVPDAVRGHLDEALEAVSVELLEATVRDALFSLVELGVRLSGNTLAVALIFIKVTNIATLGTDVVDNG